ncbi:ribonuclease R [Desulfovibrio litoralis]|uniref:Ribonuclease R n=1 Tax=Desulfovibrio litoralis DSM 11393 TaxID=1121455 RepID=A0A1M7RXC5_9BACT|nr:ribonuclease R [Desulfovibrio litoralis]SHN50821.1 RNAse R [Desulfovibrio litoralis DSM 11393]
MKRIKKNINTDTIQTNKDHDFQDGTLPDILELLKKVNRPIKLDEILSFGHISRKHKRKLQDKIASLIKEKKITNLTGGSYYPTSLLNTQTGTLQIQRSGIGFVLPDVLEGQEKRSGKKNPEDIFIRPDHFGDAWHGDRVEVIIFPKRFGKRPEGQINAIIERGRKEILVKILQRVESKGKNIYMSVPLDERLNIAILLDFTSFFATNADKIKKIKPEILVLAKLGEHLKEEHPKLWTAEALEVLNEENDLRIQERLVKANHNIPIEFPQPVLDEAELLPKEPSQSEIKEREDLQSLGFVTIDGADSKDFDDAIFIEKTNNGFCLQVAIADVAHYVKPSSLLDKEAFERGNSYYFPLSVEPMLPEKLSNELCSLKPQVPRLVMYTKIIFDKNANILSTHFANATIKSKARLTYDQVFSALDENQADHQIKKEELATLMPMLSSAKELALLLREKRKERGSLDFEVPEPKAVFNEKGELIDLSKRSQNFAHQLIEEFMLAANEAVANFLHKKDIPVLFRNHAEPDMDKLDSLFKLIAGTNLINDLPVGFFKKAEAKSIAPLLRLIKNTTQEFLIARLTLRSMMQARYSPELEGHFGLASACYCHFTSPIRRYADLLVHRSLKYALKTSDAPKNTYDFKELEAISDQINKRERSAVDAEREIFKRFAIILLQEKIGTIFTAIVSGVTDFGIFVELNEVVAEGMIPLNSLKDDYYDYIQDRSELRGVRTGRIFKLGQAVNVKLMEVNYDRLELTFALFDENNENNEVQRKQKKPTERNFDKESKKPLKKTYQLTEYKEKKNPKSKNNTDTKKLSKNKKKR